MGGGRPKYLNLCLKYSVLGLKKFLVAIFSNFIVDLDGREAVEAVIMFLSKALSSSPILISIKVLNLIREPLHNWIQLYDTCL